MIFFCVMLEGGVGEILSVYWLMGDLGVDGVCYVILSDLFLNVSVGGFGVFGCVFGCVGVDVVEGFDLLMWLVVVIWNVYLMLLVRLLSVYVVDW